MLAQTENILGQPLRDIAPFLLTGTIGNPQFHTYLETCPLPDNIPLPPGTRLFVFRDVTDACISSMQKQALDQVTDAITFWDEQGRLLALNDSAVRQESVIASEVIGRHIDDLYNNNVEGTSWAASRVMKSGQPVRAMRQDFVTDGGKHLQIITDSYPLIIQDRISGAVSIALAMQGFGVWAMAAQQISYYFSLMIVMLFTVRWYPHFLFRTGRLKQLFSFGWKIPVQP